MVQSLQPVLFDNDLVEFQLLEWIVVARIENENVDLVIDSPQIPHNLLHIHTIILYIKLRFKGLVGR